MAKGRKIEIVAINLWTGDVHDFKSLLDCTRFTDVNREGMRRCVVNWYSWVEAYDGGRWTFCLKRNFTEGKYNFLVGRALAVMYGTSSHNGLQPLHNYRKNNVN